MPTYEYQCDDCQHTFEATQSMTDKPLKKCPECGGKVTRLISCSAVITGKHGSAAPGPPVCPKGGT